MRTADAMARQASAHSRARIEVGRAGATATTPVGGFLIMRLFDDEHRVVGCRASV